MASVPERGLRRANPSFQTAFANPNMSCNVGDQVKSLEQALEPDNKSSPFLSLRKPANLTPQSNPKVFSSADLYDIERLKTQKETERVYANRINATMTRSAELALSDAFQIGFASANVELKNTFNHYVESALTETAYRGALAEAFDRNTERRTKSSTFTEAFAERALTSHLFVLPVAKCIRKNMRDENDKRK